LEVGTGFHPELTGRENIFLNGAILGMRRAEIRQKFDEIVSFAEVEKFIDTPVKHYSTGMYMRLAFAVAANLEPDILLIDEVLAVGDVGFQTKCLGKMEGVARQGRTVLFVSHNMGAVGSLCTRAIHLRKGKVFATGPAAEVIPQYLELEHGSKASEAEVLEDDEKQGYKLRVRGRQVKISCGDPLTLEFELFCPREHSSVTAGLELYNMYDATVVGANSLCQRIYGVGRSAHWKVTCNFGVIPLNAGTYYVSIWVGNKDRNWTHFVRVFALRVEPADALGWGNKVPETWGSFYWKPDWDIRAADETPTIEYKATALIGGDSGQGSY
jgi:lipopolysaccharide transport system ATP-binding protein